MVTPASAVGADVHRLGAAVLPAAVHPLSALLATLPAPVSPVAISAPHPSALFYLPGTAPFPSLCFPHPCHPAVVFRNPRDMSLAGKDAGFPQLG